MTNMPYTVYRWDRLGPGETPKNETAISHHPSASEAMDEANRLRRDDPRHSYGVGMN